MVSLQGKTNFVRLLPKILLLELQVRPSLLFSTFASHKNTLTMKDLTIPFLLLALCAACSKNKPDDPIDPPPQPIGPTTWAFLPDSIAMTEGKFHLKINE